MIEIPRKMRLSGIMIYMIIPRLASSLELDPTSEINENSPIQKYIRNNHASVDSV